MFQMGLSFQGVLTLHSTRGLTLPSGSQLQGSIATLSQSHSIGEFSLMKVFKTWKVCSNNILLAVLWYNWHPMKWLFHFSVIWKVFHLIVNTMDNGSHATFLDLDISIEKGKSIYRMFGKRDGFNFHIAWIQSITSNLPCIFFMVSLCQNL